jgi:hypothetical protein
MALEGDSGGPVFEDYGSKVAAIGTVIGYTGGGLSLSFTRSLGSQTRGWNVVTQ